MPQVGVSGAFCKYSDAENPCEKCSSRILPWQIDSQNHLSARSFVAYRGLSPLTNITTIRLRRQIADGGC